MVHKRFMALDHWLLASWESGGQSAAQPTLEQTTPLVSKKPKKCQKGDSGVASVGGTLPAQPIAPLSRGDFAQTADKTPWETQPVKQLVLISS